MRRKVPNKLARKSHIADTGRAGTSLATTPLRYFWLSRSNHCRPKRLRREQQKRPLRLQYVRTKIFYRSATERNIGFWLIVIAAPRDDAHETKR
jgi:hypothetical protein